jgi:plasmid maintenance system antidote protein VapI
MTATQSTLGSIDHMGGGDMHRAVDRMSGANVTQRAEDVGRAEGKGGPGHSEYMGRQGGQQSFGAALQDTKMAQALGISQRELGEFRQNGVITDGMAPAIGKALGLDAAQSKNLLSGMKVNHNALSVNQDDGRLMLTGAEIQSADGSRSVGGGMVTESSMMTGRQIMDKAGELEKRGHSEAAEGLRKLVNGRVASSDGRHHGMAERGRGLLENETATFSEKQSYDGRTAETYVKHGSDVSWFDTSSDRQGRTVRKGDEIAVGDHASYGDSTTLTGGTFIRGAAQMAMDGNRLLVSEISKPGLSVAERNTERLNVAGAVAADMGSLVRRTGASEDYSSAGGSIGAGIPGTKIGGAVSAGYNSRDTYDVNLGAHHYNDVLKSAEKDAAARGLNKTDSDQYTADRLQAAVQNEVRYFEEHGKWSYGATGAGARAVDAVKDIVKKNELDPTKGGVDGIKG